MLRSKDIIGLPVFTIAEGKEIGKITEILVNPGRGVVVALSVENTTKIVIFSSVKSIGADAVVIDSSSQLLEISEHRNIERWKEIKIVDSKVITSSGHYIGQVSDFLLDVTTGKVISCVASDLEGEKLVIPASRIVTFGRDALIIVDKEVEEIIGIKETEEAEGMEEALETAKEERKAEREEIKTVLEQLAEEIEKEPAPTSEEPVSAVTAQTAEPEAPAEATVTEAKPHVEPVKPVEATSKVEPAVAVSQPTEPPAEGAPKAEEPVVTAAPPKPQEVSLEEKLEETEAKIPQKEASAAEQAAKIVPPQAEETIAAKAVEVPAKESKEEPAPQKEQVKTPEEQVQAILDRHQHDFLLGKTVKKDLLADDGTIILRAGETITEEILEKTRQANKYLELGFYI